MAFQPFWFSEFSVTVFFQFCIQYISIYYWLFLNFVQNLNTCIFYLCWVPCFSVESGRCPRRCPAPQFYVFEEHRDNETDRQEKAWVVEVGETSYTHLRWPQMASLKSKGRNSILISYVGARGPDILRASSSAFRKEWIGNRTSGTWTCISVWNAGVGFWQLIMYAIMLVPLKGVFLKMIYLYFKQIYLFLLDL